MRMGTSTHLEHDSRLRDRRPRDIHVLVGFVKTNQRRRNGWGNRPEGWEVADAPRALYRYPEEGHHRDRDRGRALGVQIQDEPGDGEGRSRGRC